MRHTTKLVLIVLVLFLLPGVAVADEAECAAHFPAAEWTEYAVDGPVALATAGMNDATSERFSADVARVADLVDDELGGMAGTSVCLATPAVSDAFSHLVAPGQRLHVGVFGEEKILALSAVETRMIDDSIAFGLPQIALWQIAADLGLEQGYPEPLGSTVAHWYLARDTNRLQEYRSQLSVVIYLDDPNPEERTAEDAVMWVGDRKEDPSFFDPQFIGSQMGVFIDFAVAEEGPAIFLQTDQPTWAALEREWRIAIRDQFPRGDFGMWWGVGIVVVFVLLAILLAWGRRRQKRKAAQRRPTPPADESLFESG
ncbi:MAG: hypothetical protein GY722_24740 [bacterium]|nr:hypothetical protein [bacterium]